MDLELQELRRRFEGDSSDQQVLIALARAYVKHGLERDAYSLVFEYGQALWEEDWVKDLAKSLVAQQGSVLKKRLGSNNRFAVELTKKDGTWYWMSLRELRAEKRPLLAIKYDGSSKTLLHNLEAFPCLRDFDCEYNSVSEEQLGLIAKASQLRVLSITRAEVSGEGFHALAGHPNLQYLGLPVDSRDSQLLSLGVMPSMKCISLEDRTNLSDKAIASLGAWPSLTELDVRETRVGQHSWEALARSKIQMIRLNRCRIDDEVLCQLSNIETLRGLDMQFDKPVSDAALGQLSKLKLQKLGLSHSRLLTEQNFATISGFSSLQVLDLSCTSVTDSSLSLLSKLPLLRSLRLDACTLSKRAFADWPASSALKSIELAECEGLTDEVLFNLSNLAHLESLDLTGCVEITDAGLKRLATLPRLRRLGFFGCDKITDIGLEDLLSTNLRTLEAEVHSVSDAMKACLTAATGIETLAFQDTNRSRGGFMAGVSVRSHRDFKSYSFKSNLLDLDIKVNRY